MSLTPVSTGNSDAANLNQINNAIRQLNNETQTKVFKGPENVNAVINGKLPDDLGYGFQLSDSNGVPRIIAYIDANNNPILKVSEADQDVVTATDDQLIFNSSQNVLKVVSTGTVTMSVPALSQLNTTTVTHNLGYVPAVISFIKNPSGTYRQMPFTYWDRATNTTLAVAWADASTTDVTFNLDNNSIALIGDYTFRYYLLQETAA